MSYHRCLGCARGTTLIIVLQGPEGMEGGALAVGEDERELVFLIAHPTVAQELLEGEGHAIDTLDEAVGSETRCPGFAVLHHHADHGPSVALDDNDVVQTIGDGDGGHTIVRLEHKLAAEGVDDHSPVVEQRGPDMRAAVDGGAVDIAEGETAPQQSLKVQEHDLPGPLGTEVTHGVAAVGAALDLTVDLGVLATHLRERLGVDGIGQRTTRVEEHLVGNLGKGTYLNIRYVFVQPILQRLARGVGIMSATIGQRELVFAGVDAGGDALVEQGEADDTILATAHDPATHALHLIAADGERSQLEGWQLHGLHLTDMACGILRLDGAEGDDARQLHIVVEDTLAGACVEFETERATVEIEGDIDLVSLNLDGHSHQEITLRHEEIRVVAFDLCIGMERPCHEHHCQQQPASQGVFTCRACGR